MSANKPYSLENPPNAPKRKKKPFQLQRQRRLQQVPRLMFEEEEEEVVPVAEWRALAESGQIRPKFLRYNPEDVAELDDLDSLNQLRDWYTPASQPRNYHEWAYCTLMVDAVNDRVYAL